MIGGENDGKNGILGCKKINKNSVYGLCNFTNRKSTAQKYLYLLFFWEIKMEEKWNKKSLCRIYIVILDLFYYS